MPIGLQLVAALTMLAHKVGKDLAEPDWWRLLDALLLIAAPAGQMTFSAGSRVAVAVAAKTAGRLLVVRHHGQLGDVHGEVGAPDLPESADLDRRQLNA